jgi:outer membrane lipoprotein LolB
MMKIKIQSLGAVLLLLVLQGCAILTNTSSTSTKESLNTLETATLNEWQITGKLGLRSAHQARVVKLHWHQQNEQYQLSISGPLGTGTATIRGNKDYMEMQLGTKTYRGTPQELGLQLLGVPLPVNAISWWARAIPSPNYPAANHVVINAQGIPNSFQQAGWQLDFSGFQSVDNHILPKKVAGQHGDLYFKLVISKWDISDN